MGLITIYDWITNVWMSSKSSYKIRVQLRIEEKLSLSCGRDGGLQNMEVHGLLTLFITDESYGRVRIQVSCSCSSSILSGAMVGFPSGSWNVAGRERNRWRIAILAAYRFRRIRTWTRSSSAPSSASRWRTPPNLFRSTQTSAFSSGASKPRTIRSSRSAVSDSSYFQVYYLLNSLLIIFCCHFSSL